MNTAYDLHSSIAQFDHQAHAGWDLGDLLGLLGREFFSGQAAHGAVFGTPGEDTGRWVQQTTPFTCAVVSQEMILHMFGVNVSEAQLTYEAASHGWLTEGGTSMEHLSSLLEMHGVPCHMNATGSVDALISELARGHKVIIALDSGEMWNTDFPFEDFFSPGGADHAVVLTGLDMSDPSHPKVFINDPGDPEGAGKAYPLEQFLDAWADSGCLYVATDNAPEGLASDSIFGANFNSASGMYVNAAFWKGFLLNLARVVGQEAMKHTDGTLMPTSETASSSPWDGFSSADRNHLFMNI